MVKIGDIGVQAHVGQDPSDDEIITAVAALLEDARTQAEIGAAITASRYRYRR